MAKSRRPDGKANRLRQVINLIILSVFVILAIFYFYSGDDPLGLFTTPTPDPIVSTASGDWWDVYFTIPNTINDPENLSGSLTEVLIQLINDAQSTIDIAAFEFNLTPVAEALIAAHRRGVVIRWMTDDEHGLVADDEKDHGQFGMLQQAGIEVRDDGRTALMHNKFLIFDKKIVWTGSANITRNGHFRNNNNVIVIRSTELAAIYEREFEEMWAGEHGPRSPSTVSLQSLTINETPIFVLFAPEDKVIDTIIPLIRSAQHSIRFMAFSFTHDDLGDVVLDKANRGLDVAGIFEVRASETEFSNLTRFFCANMPVRQDGNPGTFHHKVFIIDDRIVITGSLNFSNNANQSNDENVLIITNPEIAALYLEEFEARWEEGRIPDHLACD